MVNFQSMSVGTRDGGSDWQTGLEAMDPTATVRAGVRASHRAATMRGMVCL